MKEFTDNPQCEKCKTNSVEMSYIEGSAQLDDPERLNIRCRRCGYCWRMERAE